MREIEFRAKDVVSLKWVYGVPVKFSVNCGHEHIELVEKIDYENDFDYSTFIHSKVIRPETIGQYTGLKDKNGTKIFEGDVVSVYSDCDGYYTEERNLRGVVVFNDEDFFDYEVSFNHIRNCCLEYLSNHRDNIEVIGNIYDNKELLEENK